MIKDSGDRTQFKTGAVRDMRKGKGRCDLMPLYEIGKILPDQQKQKVLNLLAAYQRVDNHDYLRMALIVFSSLAFKNPETMLLELAVHFEEGAEKYGENNWQKGIPTWCYFDSAVRHFLKWCRGDDDERHDRAFAWNIVCLLWTIENKEEKND